MPPSRNTSKNNTRDSLEVRRTRGEISCAECRRHKLKCNKTIPCATCIRKGCPEICPNGTLTPGQPTRHASSDADAQTRKLLQMSKRIQQLEDALQIAHSSLVGSTHPLLSDDLLKIKNFIERPMKIKKDIEAEDEGATSSFGTLAVLGHGIESYVGADKLVIDSLGAAEVLHLKTKLPASPTSPFSGESFTLKSICLPTSDVQLQIEGKLPSFERASALIEAYLENTTWIVRLVHREQIMEELVPQLYRRRHSGSNRSQGETSPTDPHVLALLLAIFACGAVADLTMPPWNEEAQLYYHLASISVGLRSVFDGTSLHTVQALAVLASYDIFACRKNSLEGAWKLTSFCVSLASSIGLHRDPTHFKFSPKQVQLRRRLFWELHSMDTWKSLGSGRPMTLCQSVVDCELPEDTDATVLEDGTKVPSVWGLRYRFTKEITSEVADKLASARPLKYSEILLMDQKIRDFGPDELVKLSANARVGSSVTTRDILECLMLILLKEPTLLLLHRNFFLRALIENPTDPMRSQFAPSFLATYRCATIISRGFRSILDYAGHFVVRIWPIWAHALSASVMLGSIAACGTPSAFAPEAYVEFNQSIDMLTKVQIHPLIKDLLPTVLQLRDRAYEALLKHGNGVPYSRPELLLQPPSIEGKDFNPLNTMGWTVRKSLSGHFGPPPRLNDYLDESTPQPDKPTTTASMSSRAQEDSYPGGTTTHNAVSTSRNGAGRGVFNHGQTVMAGTNSVGIPTQCMSPTSSNMMMIDPRNLSQSSQVNAMQHISDPQQSSSVDRYGLYLPQMQVDYAQDAGRTSSPLVPNDHFSGQDFGILQQSQVAYPNQTDDRNNLQRLSHGNFGSYSSGINNGDFSDAQLDSSPPPFNFDSLSDFSLESFLNNDFDVSFNMRSSAGDESIVPLISDDLEPCRTILQDSRFFGVAPEISSPGNEIQNGRS